MFRLHAQLIDDPYNNDLSILVVGDQHSIWNMWYILSSTKKYKMEVIDLETLMVVDPKKGIPLVY